MTRSHPSPSLAKLLKETLRKCVNCGNCQAVCPVYDLGHNEGQCARGKLQLALAWQDGRIDLTPELAAIFRQCGLCGRCAKACSNGVPTVAVFKAMRTELNKALAANRLVGKGVGKVFTTPTLLRSGLSLGAGTTSLLSKLVPEDSGLWLRMPMLKGLDKIAEQLIAPYVGDTPIVIQGPHDAPRLALFTGCMSNLLFYSLLDKAIEIFSKKYTVIIPSGQGCCGLPALSAGNTEAADLLARRNLEVMNSLGTDVIATVCASCTVGIRDGFHRLGAPALADKVMDGVEVLAGMPEQIAGAAKGHEVNVHVSCHLGGAGQTHLKDALLQVLEVSGAKVNSVSSRCCGGGGLLPVNARDLSGQLIAVAKEDFSDNPAPVVITGCSGCRIQWLRHVGGKVHVRHPLELLM